MARVSDRTPPPQLELTKTSYDVLAMHVVRDPVVFAEFCERTSPTTFDKVLYMPHDMIAEAAARVYRETKELPGPLFLRSKLLEVLSEHTLPDEAKAATLAFFDMAAAVGEEYLTRSWALKILSAVISAQVAKRSGEKLMRALEQGSNLDHAFEQIMADKDRRLSGIGSKKSGINPFECMERLMVKSEYHATGVDFLDVVLGGGFRRGDLVALLGGTSGGKTTLALQVAFEWIRQGPDRHTVVCSYEQPAEGDIAERLMTLATGMPSSNFRGRPFADIDHAAIDIFNKRLSADQRSRFHFKDMSEGEHGRRGMADIKAALAEFGCPRHDGAPTLVVLDWLQPLLQRAMSGSGREASDSSQLRLYGGMFMDELKSFKNKENVCVFITHQLSSEAAAAAPSRKPVCQDAAEWKGFANLTDLTFALGTLSDEYVAWLVASKTRGIAKQSRFLKLKGELCRWVDAESEYMVSSSGKVVSKDMEMEDDSEPPQRRGGYRPTAASQFMR
jgi:RecA/RadA recombinase